MAVVVSWPGGVFPGAPLTTVGGKRSSKTRKIKSRRKTRKGSKKTRRA